MHFLGLEFDAIVKTKIKIDDRNAIKNGMMTMNMQSKVKRLILFQEKWKRGQLKIALIKATKMRKT